MVDLSNLVVGNTVYDIVLGHGLVKSTIGGRIQVRFDNGKELNFSIDGKVGTEPNQRLYTKATTQITPETRDKLIEYANYILANL